jgi:hypothetical protein
MQDRYAEDCRIAPPVPDLPTRGAGGWLEMAKGPREPPPPAFSPSPKNSSWSPAARRRRFTGRFFFFNRIAEAEWRSQLEAFSDEELRALNPEDFWGALLDRVERMKRAYVDEIARRKLPPAAR